MAIIFSVLEDVKAREVKKLDVSKITMMFDHIIIATVESGRQGRAAAQKIQELIKNSSSKLIGSEGLDSGEWVLLDFGDVILHIMQPKARKFYNLEELWETNKN